MVAFELSVLPPNHARVLQLTQWIEEAYCVSIKFWLSVGDEKWNEDGIYVFATGGGDLFDRLSAQNSVFRSPILRADSGSVYPALWATLTNMEFELSKLEKPLIPRPSL